MTKLDRPCTWCGGAFVATPGRGRPRLYCRASHRQRAYEARKAAALRSLAPDEVVLPRHGWESMRGALAQLTDITGAMAADVAAGRPPGEGYIRSVAALSAAIAELQEAAEPSAAW